LTVLPEPKNLGNPPSLSRVDGRGGRWLWPSVGFGFRDDVERFGKSNVRPAGGIRRRKSQVPTQAEKLIRRDPSALSFFALNIATFSSKVLHE